MSSALSNVFLIARREYMERVRASSQRNAHAQIINPVHRWQHSVLSCLRQIAVVHHLLIGSQLLSIQSERRITSQILQAQHIVARRRNSENPLPRIGRVRRKHIITGKSKIDLVVCLYDFA